MAKTPENLNSQQISTTGLTEIYSSPAVTVTESLHLVITNEVATANTITVTFNDGSSDFVLAAKALAGGSGKSWIVAEVTGLKLNAAQSLKVQSSAATAYNTTLSGVKVV